MEVNEVNFKFKIYKILFEFFSPFQSCFVALGIILPWQQICKTGYSNFTWI